MEEVQNRLREPNKDLSLEFENLILCMPEAKLVAPVDGRHHPMMDKVMGYFVSANWSRLEEQIRQEYDPYPKVANGAETSSLRKQTKMALELLERTLVAKSENYEDPALRHFFMMNNWRHVEMVKQRESRGLIAIFPSPLFQRYSREKVRQNLELYQRSSWNKVLDFLEMDSNESVAPNIAVDKWMKGKLSLFNFHFREICRVQCTWSVHDAKLREEIMISLENILLPAYGIFLGKFQDILKNHAYDYIEYGLFDIKSGLNRLFS